VFANINHISFAQRPIVETARNQSLTSKSIGWDTSVSILYRPTFIQNVVLRASGAMLSGGGAFEELFATERKGDTFYSVLFNLILTY
jgi:hypothetical protein